MPIGQTALLHKRSNAKSKQNCGLSTFMKQELEENSLLNTYSSMLLPVHNVHEFFIPNHTIHETVHSWQKQNGLKYRMIMVTNAKLLACTTHSHVSYPHHPHIKPYYTKPNGMRLNPVCTPSSPACPAQSTYH